MIPLPQIGGMGNFFEVPWLFFVDNQDKNAINNFLNNSIKRTVISRYQYNSI